jgi:hypothetical protein
MAGNREDAAGFAYFGVGAFAFVSDLILRAWDS